MKISNLFLEHSISIIFDQNRKLCYKKIQKISEGRQGATEREREEEAPHVQPTHTQFTQLIEFILQGITSRLYKLVDGFSTTCTTAVVKPDIFRSSIHMQKSLIIEALHLTRFIGRNCIEERYIKSPVIHYMILSIKNISLDNNLRLHAKYVVKSSFSSIYSIHLQNKTYMGLIFI